MGRKKEAGQEVAEEVKTRCRQPSRKTGVRVSCERGEIAFSFHFTRLPLPGATLTLYLSPPITHIHSDAHTHSSPPSFCDC